MHQTIRILIIAILTSIILALLILSLKTWHDIQPINPSLHNIIADVQTLQVTDRNGYPLSVSYQNRWNTYDNLPLYQIPDFLKQAFIISEDQYFYQHNGLDWQARISAAWQNLRASHTVRGASTITEQVVRMIHPRPRTLWSKWIESFEAINLERQVKKADIFEFYLNQLPYTANRRGVLQAARYYFNRDLSTLTHKEMLALVILARAPSGYDLYRNSAKIDAAVLRLAKLLRQQHLLTDAEVTQIQQQTLTLNSTQLPVNAAHFISYVRDQATTDIASANKSIKTTLDANLQRKIQAIIDERVNSLTNRFVHNAAAVVVDHTTGEILAWVVAGANSGDTTHPTPGYEIDAVTSPRQPGSALKPFLYALALQSGWTPATWINDAPFSSAIGTGMHHFKNYSNTYYGEITLREALGNSLNIPALRTIQYVGAPRYLDTLHALGFNSLNRGAAIYDEGLALGNGEVSLLELVTGYTALANNGIYRPLRFLLTSTMSDRSRSKQIFSAPVASLVGNILSDSWARRLEFGTNSVLNMPVQTAVKTGTSTDYHDAWVVGFNYRYVVGIWMGNLDRTPMNGVTGSTGPALAMRSIFAELNQQQKTAPLYLSPLLVQEDVCTHFNASADDCALRSEYFVPGTQPAQQSLPVTKTKLALVIPTPGLQVAMDPRIPASLQKLQFVIEGMQSGERAKWLLNGKTIAVTDTGNYLWPLQRGVFSLKVVVEQNNQLLDLPIVNFTVK